MNHEHQGSQPVSAMVLPNIPICGGAHFQPQSDLKIHCGTVPVHEHRLCQPQVSERNQGEKFSSYLISVRIRKAKEYLASSDAGKIQNVACMVGCGNNPQSFLPAVPEADRDDPKRLCSKAAQYRNMTAHTPYCPVTFAASQSSSKIIQNQPLAISFWILLIWR